MPRSSTRLHFQDFDSGLRFVLSCLSLLTWSVDWDDESTGLEGVIENGSFMRVSAIDIGRDGSTRIGATIDVTLTDIVAESIFFMLFVSFVVVPRAFAAERGRSAV